MCIMNHVSSVILFVVCIEKRVHFKASVKKNEGTIEKNVCELKSAKGGNVASLSSKAIQ